MIIMARKLSGITENTKKFGIPILGVRYMYVRVRTLPVKKAAGQ